MLRFFFFGLVLLPALVLRAQEALADLSADLTPRIRSFTPTDYGAENQNWDLAQDGRGNLYVANSGGVLRFDGLRWKTFQLPGRPTVRCLSASDERLYVGGYAEFGYFSGAAGETPVYTSLSNRLPEGERKEEIWNIEVLADSTVVFQSFARLYAFRGDRIVKQDAPGGLMFARARGEELLLPINERGLARWTPEGERGLLTTAGWPAGQRIVSIATTSKEVLVATPSEIFRLDTTFVSWSEEANTLLTDQRINRVLSLNDGSLAVGTILSGLYLFGPDGKLRQHLQRTNGLSNNTVLSLFEDIAGNLWVGLDRGLDLIVRSEPLRYYNQREQTVGTVYAAIVYGGCHYLGTNQGLFRHCGDKFELVPGTSGQVWELKATARGLLCGHNEGTFLIEDDRATKISDRSGGWQTRPVTGSPGCYLQATYTGMSVLDITQTGKGETERRLPEFGAPIRFIYQQEPGKILALHGSRGAYRLQLADDLSGIVAIDTITEPDLLKPMLTEFGDTLLIQTREAIYEYRNGAFDPVTIFRGAPLEAGQYCLPGAAGTDEWFLVADDRVRAFRGSREVASLPVNLRKDYPQIIPLAHGNYLMCLQESFAIYDLRPLEMPEAVLSLAMHSLDAVRNADARFTYALTAFDRQTRYRYRLRGFTEEWSDWSNRGDREFNNLYEGNYTFEVEADWFRKTATHTFTVLPPWYRTVWAYFFYAVAVVSLLAWLYFLHHRRLIRQARQLEAVRQRQLQRQRIVSRNQQLEKDVSQKSRELANTTLTLAKKNEMLLTLKEELAKKNGHQRLLHLIDRNLNNEEDWAIFESHFNEVHEAFLKRLRGEHPDLTSGELQLAAYLRMDLSSKEIAPLLHISTRGVENKRYRLRKKLALEGTDNLNQYLQEL